MSDRPLRENRIIPQAAVSAAIFHKGKVLLVQRARPPATALWSFPGGHIEPGETAIDAVHREIFEETAIRSKISGVCGVRDVVQQNDRGDVLFHRVIIVFCGVWADVAPKAGSDAGALRWEHPHDLAGLSTTDGLVELALLASKMLEN